VDEVHTGFIGPYVRQLLEGTEFHTSCIASIPSLQAEVMDAWFRINGRPINCHKQHKYFKFHMPVQFQELEKYEY
jgi:hypothetical protein